MIYTVHERDVPGIFDGYNTRPCLNGSEPGAGGRGMQHQQDHRELLRYYKMLRSSPVSIWEEDFSDIKKYFDEMRKRGVRDLRRHFSEHPDEVLSLACRVKIIDVNDATLRLYEAGSKEELCSGLNVIFNKASYNVFREELIALSEGKSEFQGETVNITTKGEEKHILLKLTVTPGHEESLSSIFIFIVDISNIRRLEEHSKDSEQKYRRIVETAYDAILVADAETGIILEANQKAEHLIGVAVDEIVGMHFTQLHPKEDEAFQRDLFQAHLKQGRYYSESTIVCNKRGEKIPVSISSSVFTLGGKKCISAIFKEMTQKRRAQSESLKRSKHTQKLSERECEILQLIASGFTTKQAAEKLHISDKTVQTHRARIMQKLGIHKTADLVRYAVYSGLCQESYRDN